MRATEGVLTGHLVTEGEARGHPNAVLRDVETLCGHELETTGSYKIGASVRHGDTLEEWLEERAERLCVECLNEAVDHHGWPTTASVLKAVVDS